MTPMAGGMNRRASYGTMADRLAATHDAQVHRDALVTDEELAIDDARATSEELVDRPRPHDVRHVWVTTSEGRMAGLLIEWRHDSTGWRGRCVYPLGHLVVEDWVPAAQLEPS